MLFRSDLQVGENTLTVTVTAADGETTASYTVVLNVLLSSNTALASFQVNGSDVADGDTVELDPYTTEVEVTVETVDENATVEIVGDTVNMDAYTTEVEITATAADENATVSAGGSVLVPGDNAASVTVTAADGTVRVYNFNIYVTPLSSNTALSLLFSRTMHLPM